MIPELWELPQREYQYTAIELWMKSMKELKPEDIDLLQWCIVNKSWWDTVDGLAANLAGRYFKLYPDKIESVTGIWVKSDNMWLRRTAILFQLKYKDDTDVELLFSYVKKLAHEKEFFIKKAIGWSIREYSKTKPEDINKFISENQLQPLSRVEGLKVINRMQK
jgi:3-methyladenine DNA glycosylase AlkD